VIATKERHCLSMGLMRERSGELLDDGNVLSVLHSLSVSSCHEVG